MKPLLHRFVVLLLLALPATASAQAQQEVPAIKADDLLAITPRIKTGTLDNGLKYFIRANKKPENRAEFRLVVKTGSVLEDNDQQGLAHFVEHMAFNGTKSFPKQDLINFMERVGMRLGPDVNAYTSFDETVYMLQVPTDSPHIFQKGLQILHEWASAVVFDGEEIDKERGVVVEEWRIGRGARERVQNKHNPVIFHASQYAERLPIGKKEVLDTCSYDALRRFYRDWYRPDLMAVILVGDFDLPAVEQQVRALFGGLKNPNPLRPRRQYVLPDHNESLISVATDAELPFTSVSMLFKRNEDEEKTVGDYRRDIIGALYDGMLNARIQERLRQPNPPFIFCFSGNSQFVGEKQAYQLFAAVKENAILEGFDAMLSEAFRIKQHGFTATELERQKKERLRALENSYNEREKTESRIHASELIRHFLRNEPVPGIEMEFEIHKQFLPGITLAELNSLANIRITPGNRIVTISAPKKENLVIPAEADFRGLLTSFDSKKLDPYVDNVSEQPLLPALPNAGSVIREGSHPKIGVTKWTLSNGARVFLKTTDFKNDEVLFAAHSDGGSSLAPDSIYLSAGWAASVVAQSGVGTFDATALQKTLAGKVVRVSPSIASLSEGLNGNASPQDLETLFQLVHLYFTSPRKDTASFSALLARQRAFLENQSVSPEGTFFDTVQVTMTNYHYRGRPLTLQLLKEINIDRAFSFYRERFADAGDFTFFFVGNFQLEAIKPLVEKYLASLPALKKKESWRDEKIMPPKGTTSKQVYKGIEPKSLVQLSLHGPFEWNRQNRYDFQSMIELLRIKLREVMREEKGGVYGVQVFGSPTLHPRQEYRIQIAFGCDPQRVDELLTAVREQIDSLKLVPPNQTYIEKIQEIQRREREVSLKENRFWLNTIRSSFVNDENPEDVLLFPKQVDGLTAKAIHDAAIRFFDMKNVIQLVLYPEKK